MVGAGLGDSGEQREQEMMLPRKKTGTDVRSRGLPGLGGQFYNQEEMEEMEPQGGSPACPHPHHSRHPGIQDEDGARSPSLHQHPPPASASQAAPFQAFCPQGPGCRHQGWTSPDGDNSATPRAQPLQPQANTPCGLGPSQAPTPQLTRPQLPCCFPVTQSAHTPWSLLHNFGARAWHPHTPGGPTVPQKKQQPCIEDTGPSRASCHRELGSGGEGP